MQRQVCGRSRGAWIAVAWLVAVGGGFAALVDYGSAPGDPGAPVVRWPASAGLERDGARDELLLFAHALCPCTQASLSELERLLARVPEPPRTRVVLWSDPGQPERFARSRLRERVLAVPAIELVEDPGGRLARAFGAVTSGMALAFDTAGRLRFAGGLTPSRGHEGDAVGTLALVEWLRGGAPATTRAPVFGCPLEDPAPEPRP